MSIRLRIMLVALIAAVLAVNGAATLYAAATAPTIRACVGARGAMTYTSTGKCPTGQKVLTWNVTGPQGPTGSAGGSAGGAPAPAPYWVAEWAPEPFFSGASASTSLAVPAGTYLVSLQLALTSDTSSVPDVKPIGTAIPLTTVTCTLAAGPESQTFAAALYEGWQVSLSHQLVATTTGGKATVTCSQKSAGDAGIAPFLRLAIDGLLTATPIVVQ